MISSTKICGISDPKTLNYILNHPHPPSLIGFICNYKTSPRYVEFDKLKELLKINKKQSKYVAVIVKDDSVTLKNIKNLPFDYYQLYGCSPDEVRKIKETYKKKIITALTDLLLRLVKIVTTKTLIEVFICLAFFVTAFNISRPPLACTVIYLNFFKSFKLSIAETTV